MPALQLASSPAYIARVVRWSAAQSSGKQHVHSQSTSSSHGTGGAAGGGRSEHMLLNPHDICRSQSIDSPPAEQGSFSLGTGGGGGYSTGVRVCGRVWRTMIDASGTSVPA